MTDYPVTLPGTTAPVLMWAQEHEVEAQALQQLRAVAELPGMYGLRVMPDVHFGKGATVGSVIAMEQALAPAAVGVDIGCGVNAVRTSLTLEDVDAADLKALRYRFENVVPVGFAQHSSPILGDRDLPRTLARANRALMSRFGDLRASVSEHEAKAAAQLGTLGGGNHFIELTSDSTGRLWLTLHSGSRGIGNLLAREHISRAMDDPRNADLPRHLRELSLFYKGTPELDAYLHDLHWAQAYAMLSRTTMMELVKHELVAHWSERRLDAPTFDEEINCHHNYVAEEVIDGRDMIVTRKGAISAKAGELALIPGSMATGSYIVRGKGNPASFQSASHGAGRKMSRSAAKRRYTVEDVKRTMAGIEARTDEGVIDEISLAYKNLDDVIAAQADLVEVVEKLETILCVKG
ncbi:RtcB-like RNA ligase [Microbacterium phage Cen1621]|uniref:3'-phosphate/5'-hydroxy nucleic acid ligase n=1 Tax=Microbacterium phage Cen1621 TaxID=2965191 RepID=A0A9E7TWW1_9CAUD|nr:RtcB-like RNA ligase [Microbacterium phage Cen1621]